MYFSWGIFFLCSCLGPCSSFDSERGIESWALMPWLWRILLVCYLLVSLSLSSLGWFSLAMAQAYIDVAGMVDSCNLLLSWEHPLLIVNIEFITLKSSRAWYICFASLTFNRAGITSTSPGRACISLFLFPPLQFIFRYIPEYMTRAIETVSSNNI